MDTKKLVLSGEVNDKMYQTVVGFLSRTEGDFEIEIASGGGSTGAAFAIYDRLKLHSGKIKCTVFQASSAAVIIVQACAHRVAFTHSLMHLHYGTVGLSLSEDRLVSPAQVERILLEVKGGMQAYDRIILERGFKGSAEDLNKLYAAESSIVGEELLRLGLVDEVIDTVSMIK